MALPAIELKNISVVFDTNNSNEHSVDSILENISLRIDHDDRIVLVGPSGQGKSVLLKVMAGLIPPTKGQVLIEGEDLYSVTIKRRQEIMFKMGMLFQKNALFDSLTNFENIAFPLREVTQKGEQEITAIADQFLDAVGIGHARHLYPDEISGGMQKRLGIARALALNPKTIFFDDPTAGLDPITSRTIIDLILNLCAQNKTTLVAVTNEMNRAYQMATRIGMVVDKGLIETGSAQETKHHIHPKVKQFVHGELTGPLLRLE